MDAELGAAAFRAALSAKYFSTVKKIYESASQHGIRFPDNIYSIAVGGLVLCGRLEEGLAMKSKVESRGGKLELFGYNAIIEVISANFGGLIAEITFLCSSLGLKQFFLVVY
mmetsp:Transcript_35022/g.138924  ORF Transcript_35022/g.138924 Transcript_35022/m.138924 type:complete len:112 (-) Transcript_35022:6189-6524(-)